MPESAFHILSAYLLGRFSFILLLQSTCCILCTSILIQLFFFFVRLTLPLCIMAARSSSRKIADLCQLSTALSSAFMEWLLMFLLLVDALCLYLVLKIFHCSKLQTPCLLCSRFSWVFGEEKLGLLKDLVCDVHKLEISTFSFCHVHRKLADAGRMCESCLLSFPQSNLKKCNVFLSKLNVDPENGDQILHTNPDEMDEVPLLEKNHEVHYLHKQPCSYCSQSYDSKSYAYKLSQRKPLLNELPHLDIRLPVSSEHAGAHLSSRFSKEGEIPSKNSVNYHLSNNGIDHLSHFRYKELNFASESELEVPLFGDDIGVNDDEDDDDDDNDDDDDGDDDGDDGSTKSSGTEDVKEQSVALKSLCMVSDNIVPEKSIHPDTPMSDATASVTKGLLHEGDSCEKSILESINVLGHGLEEIDRSNVEAKSNPRLFCQITLSPVSLEISNVEGVYCTSDIDVSKSMNSADVRSKPGIQMTDTDNILSSDSKGARKHHTSDITLVSESPRIGKDLKCCLPQDPPDWFHGSSWTDYNSSAGERDEG